MFEIIRTDCLHKHVDHVCVLNVLFEDLHNWILQELFVFSFSDMLLNAVIGYFSWQSFFLVWILTYSMLKETFLKLLSGTGFFSKCPTKKHEFTKEFLVHFSFEEHSSFQLFSSEILPIIFPVRYYQTRHAFFDPYRHEGVNNFSVLGVKERYSLVSYFNN